MVEVVPAHASGRVARTNLISLISCPGVSISPSHRLVLILLVVALLGVRLGGAHVHLCFDGSEPPASVHYEDDVGSHHGEPGAPGNPGDVDISLAGELILKASKPSLDLPVALLGALILWLPIRVLAWRDPAPRRAPVPLPLRLRLPPARGPPLLLPH